MKRLQMQDVLAVCMLLHSVVNHAQLLLSWMPATGRDYVHQLAILNVETCQLLTMLLRTCPRSIGREAAQVSPA
jgi:hypothetical protein